MRLVIMVRPSFSRKKLQLRRLYALKLPHFAGRLMQQGDRAAGLVMRMPWPGPRNMRFQA